MGLLLSVAGAGVLIHAASLRGTAWHVVGGSVFGAALVLLYAASTLYHGLSHSRAKRIFRVLDHAAIYLLIAGTYTPFLLVNLRGVWGWTLLGVVWSLAALGVTLEAAAPGRLPRFSLALYLALGWLIVLAARPLVAAVAPAGIGLLVLGGVAYTAGVVFYVWQRAPYHHAVWHLFVLAGSTAHFFAVFLYVIPPAPHV